MSSISLELSDEQYNALIDLFPGCSVDVMSHIEEFSVGFRIIVMKAVF